MPITLGELTDALSAVDPEMPVRFDRTNGARPGEFASWRGDYAQLTLCNFDDVCETAGDLLRAALNADHGVFGGYKGGDFVMGRHTPVWADQWGECPGRGITDTTIRKGTLVLITEFCDY
jgi:hypothetical protein